MKVEGKEYRTVWMQDGAVHYIAQDLLPFHFLIRSTASFRDCCRAIRTMEIRGAGAIGTMAGFAMALAAREAAGGDDLSLLRTARIEIESTRPTARNLFYAVEKVFEAALSGPEMAETRAREIADRDAADSRQIGEIGNGLIFPGMSIATHCNAGWLAFTDYGTALSPVYRAHAEGKKIFVYADETRPRGQGARLTAWELGQAGVPHAIIPDNALPWLMSLGRIDLMIVGADCIAANGDTANKIGTLGKALAAKAYGVPFYVAAPTSTIDVRCPDGAGIPIEERNPAEVLYQEGITDDGRLERIRVCAPGSAALNPAFDVTPAGLITGIITEHGIFDPHKLPLKSE